VLGETIRTLIQANHARLRPILMTTIAMVFGMFLHWHRELEQDGKTVWLGYYWRFNGSLFLTLIIVPVIYEIMENSG
jgi:HAE1 family hydrophobic/amphiphilic exporter-1